MITMGAGFLREHRLPLLLGAALLATAAGGVAFAQGDGAAAPAGTEAPSLTGLTSSPSLTSSASQASSPGTTTSASGTTSPSGTPSLTPSRPAPSASLAPIDGHVGGTTLVIKDGHYGPLYVGMNWKAMVRSGWIQRNPSSESSLADVASGREKVREYGHCVGFFVDRYRNGNIDVSDNRGIESMGFSRGVRTDRGVTIGTPWEDMLRAYHHPKIDETHGRAIVPLHGKVQLEFDGIDGPHGRQVFMITIARSDQYCYE